MASFTKGIKWNAIATISSSVIAVVKLSILAGYLSKAELGSLAIIMFVVSLAEIGIEGGAASVVYFRQSSDKLFYSTLHWFVVANGLLFATVILAISPLLFFFFENKLLSDTLPFVSIAVIISSTGKISRTLLSKNLEFKKLALIDLTGAVVGFAVLIALIIMGYGIYGVLYSIVASYTLVSGLLIKSVKKHKLIGFFFSIKLVKESMKISSYSFLSQVFNFFTKEIDIIIIGKLMSVEFLGGYSLAKQLFQKPSKIITPIISKVSLPVISSNSAESDKIGLYQKITSMVFSLNAISFVSTVLFGFPAIVVLYGLEWSHIYPIGIILSLSAWMHSSRGTLGSLTTAFGRTDYELVFSVSCALISSLILYTGCSIGDMSITYVALIISAMSTLVPLYFLVRKLTHMSLSNILKMFLINRSSVFNSINMIYRGV